MRCPYCDTAIYIEKEFKEHIDWQHWNEQRFNVWLTNDLSRYFPVDEDGNPIIPEKEKYPEPVEDTSSNSPFGPGSDFNASYYLKNR